MKSIAASAVTKTGRRQNNQDNFMLSGIYATLEHGTFRHRFQDDSDRPFLAAVCDGMGGEASGERASLVACNTIAKVCGHLTNDFSANKRLVTESVLRANSRLCEIMQREQTGRMGSTVVAVLIQNDHLFYTNLGDSRLYLSRNGELIQLTKDHTEGQMMVDAGVLTADQLRNHPSRNKLNRHLGISPDELHLECPVYRDIALVPGDRLLIASDGVFGVLDNRDMNTVLSEGVPIETKAERLVDLAYERGSRDNMTALVIEIRAVQANPTAAQPRIAAVQTQTQRPAKRRLPVGVTILIVFAAVFTTIMLSFSLLLTCICSPTPKPKETPAQPASRAAVIAFPIASISPAEAAA